MTTRPRALLLLASLALAALFSGCSTAPASDTSITSTIPGARPAAWQGGLPGMGNISGNNGSPTGGNGLR